MNYEAEKDMMMPFAKTFIDQGFRVFEEVPIFTKVIDAYLLNENSGLSLAVEFKLSNWRKGLDQAKHYLLCAQEVYVAIDAAFSHRALRYKEEFERLGIGLISVNGQAKVCIEAKLSPFYDEFFHQRCLEFLKNRSGKEVLG